MARLFIGPQLISVDRRRNISDPTVRLPRCRLAVYLFRQENQVWVEQQKIGSPDAEIGDQFARNIAVADKYIRQAAAKGAEFVLTPEMTTLLDFGTKQVMEKISTEEEDTS